MINPLDYVEWSKVVAKRYKGKGLLLEDLEGEASVGLMKACKKYDETLGVRFEYYAEWWIGREIREALVKNRLIFIPRVRFYEAKRYLKGNLTKRLSKSRKELLFDAVYSLGIIQDNSMEDIIDHFDDNAENYDKVLFLLNDIALLESEIIQLKLGLDGSEELSFGAIGKLLNFNSGTAFYHYKKGIKKLKTIFESKLCTTMCMLILIQIPVSLSTLVKVMVSVQWLILMVLIWL